MTKRFGSLTAVDNLSFTVAPGKVTGFLGPNGAGKTTTLRMALGLTRPTRGTATFEGLAYEQLPSPMRQVGAALEASSFHPGRTATDHLAMLASGAGIDQGRCAQVLDIVGLGSVGDRRVGGFSMGMRARLGLAVALLGDPKVLLLDEPTNGLDPEGIVWMRDLMRHLAGHGKAVLVSSHLLSEVQQSVDDVVIIAHGRLVHASPLADLAREHEQNRTDVVAADPAALASLAQDKGWALADGVVVGPSAAEIGAAAFAAGVELHQLATQRGGLEAAFLALTEGHGDIR
ncbi:MAG: ATP-binding cassette domain-containing protein [Micrococcales bacterium]|nr:ATP-binding cassette domain-containing protein [Micrococcales bacterium]MCL2666790.1 ATP-binding cassette domain-containing protein [Micrococcales bacterium]